MFSILILRIPISVNDAFVVSSVSNVFLLYIYIYVLE